MPDELRLSIEKLIYGGDGLAHADGNTISWKSEVPSFSKMRRLPLPAHSCRGAASAQERNPARDAFAAWRGYLGWRDRRTFGGAVRISQPGAMGGAKRDAAGAGIFLAGELGDRADR